MANVKKVASLITEYDKIFSGFYCRENKVIDIFNEIRANHFEIIKRAKYDKLLAASIVYFFLAMEEINGKSPFTYKAVADFFGITPTSILAKTKSLKESISFKLGKGEFIDEPRFKANQIFYEISDKMAKVSEKWDEEMSPEIMKKIFQTIEGYLSLIKMDPYFFDSYLALADFFEIIEEPEQMEDVINSGFTIAMKLITTSDGNFPQKLDWGFIENRHIIRMLRRKAMYSWERGENKLALSILQNLLASNPFDNIGARYSILGILEGYESQWDYEEQFMDESGLGISAHKINKWFEEKMKKYPDYFDDWFEIVNEE